MLNPVHGVLTEGEGGLEHDIEDEEEDGESEQLMRQHAVDGVGGAVGVLLRPCGEFRLLQGTVDEAVLGVHDGRLRVFASLLFHAGGGHVANVGQVVEVAHALLPGKVAPQIVEHVAVVLE